jgi:hypothetical protein
MAEAERSQHWFNTIPGILTAIATLIAAVTGLLVTLNQIGYLDYKQRLQETIGDPYSLGTVPDREIDKIIDAAQTDFKYATRGEIVPGSLKNHDTDLKFSACKDAPTIAFTYPFRLPREWSKPDFQLPIFPSSPASPRSARWSCRVHLGTTNVNEIIRQLDSLAKPLANAIPADWKLETRPGPGTRPIRLSAADPTGTLSMVLEFNEAENLFTGSLTFRKTISILKP